MAVNLNSFSEQALLPLLNVEQLSSTSKNKHFIPKIVSPMTSQSEHSYFWYEIYYNKHFLFCFEYLYITYTQYNYS